MASYRLIAVTTLSGIIRSNSLWIAAITTVVFTALARFMRGVSRSGAVAGAVICFALIASAGLGAFIGLISVFALKCARHRRSAPILVWPRLVRSYTPYHTATLFSWLRWLLLLRKLVPTLYRASWGRLRTASHA